LKKFIYNFNISNEYANEWDKLQSWVQQYSKIHEINGWENINLDEIMLEPIPKKWILTDMEGIESYDLVYEHTFEKQISILEIKHWWGPTTLLGATRAPLDHYFILRIFLEYF
jgi:hypothetical protein